MHYMLTMRDIQIAVFDIVDHMRHVRGEVPLNTDQPATSEISSALVKSEKVVLGVRFGRYGAADASRPGVETLGLESSFRERVFPSRTLKGSRWVDCETSRRGSTRYIFSKDGLRWPYESISTIGQRSATRLSKFTTPPKKKGKTEMQISRQSRPAYQAHREAKTRFGRRISLSNC